MSDKRVDAALNAWYPGEDWQSMDIAERSRRDMAEALRAADAADDCVRVPRKLMWHLLAEIDTITPTLDIFPDDLTQARREVFDIVHAATVAAHKEQKP